MHQTQASHFPLEFQINHRHMTRRDLLPSASMYMVRATNQYLAHPHFHRESVLNPDIPAHIKHEMSIIRFKFSQIV